VASSAPYSAQFPSGITTFFNTSTANIASLHVAPIALTGSIFSGLSPTSSLQLSVVWYYEDFPSPVSDILTLAKPSCEYDPVALKMYTEVLNKLPVVVPANWNPAGEWFWDVVTAIREHAASVGTMIGGAPGAVIGKAASTVAGWAQDRYMTAPGSSVPVPSGRRGGPKNKALPGPKKRGGVQGSGDARRVKQVTTTTQVQRKGKPPEKKTVTVVRK
jgi:hypothetical protein